MLDNEEGLCSEADRGVKDTTTIVCHVRVIFKALYGRLGNEQEMIPLFALGYARLEGDASNVRRPSALHGTRGTRFNLAVT